MYLFNSLSLNFLLSFAALKQNFMRKVNVVALLIFLFAACKKNDKSIQLPLTAQTLSNLWYGSDSMQRMDIYLPAGRTDTTKIIVLAHGGSWTTGDKSDFDSLVPVLQQYFSGYAIANVNYRLATQTSNRFPAQETDMKSAVNFLNKNVAEYHVSPKMILFGASSGAQMALLQAYKYSLPNIKAVVDFFGPTDMSALYNSFKLGSANWLGMQVLMTGDPTTNPDLYSQSSPVNFITSQTPPTIILHGDADSVVPVSQSIALRDKLNGAGVINQYLLYPNQGHELWKPIVLNDALMKIAVFVKANIR